MDYRILLIKYMQHVGNEEDIDDQYDDDLFTKDEWEELNNLDSESLNDD